MKTASVKCIAGHFSWYFTCRQLCFFFYGQNIQTPPFLHQPPCHIFDHRHFHIICALTLSSCHSPLIFQSSPLPQNPKSTRSCPTVQTNNLTQIRSPPGFLKNVHPYLFPQMPQSPILSTSPSSPVSFIPLSKNPLSHHC